MSLPLLGAGSGSPVAGIPVLDDLLIHVDVSNANNRYQDSLKTTLATDNGDPIGALAGLSGTSVDWLQAAAGQRPTLVLPGQNGRGYAQLDGTDDSWNIPDNTFSGVTACEMFAVLQIDNDPPAQSQQGGGWKIGSGTFTFYPFTTAVIFDSFATDTRKTTGNPAQDLEAWHAYQVVSAANLWTSWHNGTQHFTTGTNTVGFAATGLMFGENSNNDNMDGNVGEVIIYKAPKTAGDRTLILNFLSAKWGLGF